MIKVFGLLVNLETIVPKAAEMNPYQKATVLASSRDRIYQLTDYDNHITKGMLEKNLEVPVKVSASKTGYLNLVVEINDRAKIEVK